MAREQLDRVKNQLGVGVATQAFVPQKKHHGEMYGDADPFTDPLQLFNWRWVRQM
jgi:hypothetical protein